MAFANYSALVCADNCWHVPLVEHLVILLLLRQVSSISPASTKETCFAAEGAYDWCNMRQDRQLLTLDLSLEQRDSYSSNKMIL